MRFSRTYNILICFFMIIIFSYIDANGVTKKGKWKSYNVDVSENEKPVNVIIYYPKGFNDESKLLFVLAGYYSSNKEWKYKSNIKYLADKYNMVVICPDISKTVYETEYFNESKYRWRSMSPIKWFGSKLIPYLKNLGLEPDKENSAILGVSMGARGALMLAINYPDYFGVVCCISGFYDKLSFIYDKKFEYIYGKFNNHKKRWDEVDNILKQMEDIDEISFFIAHGGKDSVAPLKQAYILLLKVKNLKKEHPDSVDYVFQVKRYGLHNWDYFKKVLPQAMQYIDTQLKNK